MVVVNTYPYSSQQEKSKIIKNELRKKRFIDLGGILYCEDYIEDESTVNKMLFEYKKK